MIVRVSRARLRRDKEDGAFEFLRKAGPTWSQPGFFPQLQDAIIDSTVEHFETIAEQYEDLATLGLGLALEGGS